MAQPSWKFIANLGDVNPLEHGGLFVFVDTTGVYEPECSKIEPLDNGGWMVWEYPIDRCTITNGILSDNKYHPNHPAWFAHKLEGIANTVGQTRETLTAQLTSSDPVERAIGYESIAEYYGYTEFDNYPVECPKKSNLPNRIREALDSLKQDDTSEMPTIPAGWDHV